MGLTVDQAASAAKLPLGDVLAMEEGRDPGHAFARIHAASYARLLGLDPVLLRKDLPDSPDLIPSSSDYLRNVTRPSRASVSFSLHLLAPLAPLGRACVYLLMVATLMSTWGLMRQLSRVRSIPWITSTSSLSSFQVR
jgi:cytoskeletal protein RodZ